jgi:dGTPase
MLNQQELIGAGQEELAPYAVSSRGTRGRAYPEPESRFRTPFQRDRDRVIHCRSFRRLEYKTQVFVNHEGDHYRTRLTHTLEAAQIARSIGRTLRLNEDLIEVLALSHDLGHTPFGHSGEREINLLLKEEGGFDHNRQTLRVVELLEHRYPEFPGLNLTFEVREGIVKHSGHWQPRANEAIYEPQLRPTLEAQVTMIADEIAYNNHDLDDGLASGLIEPESLAEVRLWGETFEPIRAAHRESPFAVLKQRAISGIITRMVEDLLEATFDRIRRLRDPQDARQQARILVDFSPQMAERHQELKDFLFRRLYTHYRVIRMEEKARRVLREIFHAYLARPEQLPADFRQFYPPEEKLPRILADYIAGMTDRYAIEEHRKLFDPLARV